MKNNFNKKIFYYITANNLTQKKRIIISHVQGRGETTVNKGNNSWKNTSMMAAAHCTPSYLMFDACSHMFQAGGSPTNWPVLCSKPTCHSCLKPVGAEISLMSSNSDLAWTSKLAFEPRFFLKKFISLLRCLSVLFHRAPGVETKVCYDKHSAHECRCQ